MIVFDASTLILLAKAELLESFLMQSTLAAVVPREVAREACEEKSSFDSLLIRRLIAEKQIALESLRERTLFNKLRLDLGLGLGEAEAIALAVARSAQLAATDDKRAIDACKLVRMPFTSAVAILVRMHEKGAIDQQSALLKLGILERAGRYKKSIIGAARLRLEEE
ncbi:MAG TPA: hypothetical protein VNY05_15965 [Candidatus Acidoferrales bacterium]|nr:hypothetical protein [Candidatus Acidoferrales bacterium]